jgi:hypothetical protein
MLTVECRKRGLMELHLPGSSFSTIDRLGQIPTNDPMSTTLATFLKLAPTISRQIATIWLELDNSKAQGISDVVKLISERTTDVLVQRKAQRQIESISEKIVESLVPFFQQEFSGFDEASVNLILDRTIESLVDLKLSTALLAKHDFEPTTIYELAVKVPHFSEGLSQRDTDALKRILREVLCYLVDVASSLPNYAERTVAEILRRETHLIESAEAILKELDRIRHNLVTDKNPIDVALFEANYRQTVVRRFDELELYGVDLPPYAKRRRLSVAYVSLNVAQADKSPRPPEDNLLPKKQSAKEASNGSATLTSIETLLSKSSKILIKGQAGSGKTTLLQWIAVSAANKTIPATITGWGERVPFFITLRSFADKELPTPDELVRILSPVIAAEAPASWCKEQLRTEVDPVGWTGGTGD